MTLEEAVSARHTVRKYKNEPLPDEIKQKLIERADMWNNKFRTRIKLVAGNKAAFTGPLKLLGGTVSNYFILAGEYGGNSDKDLGYAGADLMLYAQTLGLNSWFIAGTYNKSNVEKESPGADVRSIIAVGYGAGAGKPHKSKTLEQVCDNAAGMPDWAKNGARAALAAPTALNRQNFVIHCSGGKVGIDYKPGAFSDIDLGIVTYFFEVGAGRSISEQ